MSCVFLELFEVSRSEKGKCIRSAAGRKPLRLDCCSF
jgi:hypothetical protein